MIPTTSTFPDTFDTDDNLFLVHDGLRLTLLSDYNPGDTSIQVTGDFVLLNRFPPTGLITLTEQCSEVKKRAISFYYSSVDYENGVFNGLELLPEFVDVIKPKTITHVTQNVMAKQHNHLKDALKEIQGFIGVKGTIDTEPYGPTLEGRINFLRKVVLVPKAWFTMDVTQGIVPLEVEFTEHAFRMGTDGTAGPVSITWDFGDQTTSTICLISVSNEVPDDSVDVIVRDTDRGTIKKTYHYPGVYTVKMTVENDFGSDELILDDIIHVRTKAPGDATIHYDNVNQLQVVTPGVPANGPFQSPPVMRSPINTLIQISVPIGENPSNEGYSYAGELLDDNGNPVDPIDTWTWALGDDLVHDSSPSTTASFSVGGIYDLKLRCDTSFGAYRITTYDDSIDIIEKTNMWLWLHEDDYSVRSYEYGLISETFKLTQANSLTVTRNESFLNNVKSEVAQKAEFRKNTGFSARSSTTNSGSGGTALLYWASGRTSVQSMSVEKINVVEYQGFSDIYLTKPTIDRTWNWCQLAGTTYSYFFGGEAQSYPNLSPVNTNLTSQNLVTLASMTTTLSPDSYINGAQELEYNSNSFDLDGHAVYGNFSVYRTAWKDRTGYIARNDAMGPFFRIKSFYRTSGSISDPITHIEKLSDIEGQTKTELAMTDLSAGIYVFNNSGSVVSYNPTNEVWYKGGPGANSAAYRSFQDTAVDGFDDLSNTLLVTSDKDKRAYISFDYSRGAFVKFNEVTTTFSLSGTSRPEGDQFIMSIY